MKTALSLFCGFAALVMLMPLGALGQIKVGSTPKSIDLPVQTYAAIDISGTTAMDTTQTPPVPANVLHVALDDSGNFAFGYGIGTPGSMYTGYAEYHSYTWQSGVLGTVKILPCSNIPIDPDGPDAWFAQEGFVDSRAVLALSASGNVYGNQYTIGGDPNDFDQKVFKREGTLSTFYAPPHDYATLFAAVSDNGIIAGQSDFTSPSSPDPSIAAFGFSFLYPAGTGTIYEFGSNYADNDTGSISTRQLDFTPLAVNSQSWAIGISGDLTPEVWDADAEELLPLGSDRNSSASGLNDQGQIIVNTSDGNGFLWESQTLSNITETILGDTLPNAVQGQIATMSPSMLSNQNATDSGITIMSSAQVIENATTGGVVPETLISKRDSSGNWTFAKMQLPAGVTISTYEYSNSGFFSGSSTLNSSGLIAAIGKPTPAATTNHALLLLPAEMAVDSDRNSTIVMANDANNPANAGLPVDTTSAAKPFRFWINNDQDNGAPNSDTTPYASEVIATMDGTPNEGPVPDVSIHDCSSNVIVSMRDLEDWTRLWIYTKGLNQAIHDAHILVGLKWKKVTRGIPGIKIVQATDSDGGTEYLTDSTFAAASAQATDGSSPRSLIQDEASSSYIISASASSDPNRTADFVFPSSTWTHLTDAAPKTFFLFEGASNGEGELEIVFLNADTGAQIGEGGSLWLDLRDIKEMYERESSQPTPAKPYNYAVTPPTVSMLASPDQTNPNGSSGVFVPDPNEDTTNKTYIVFVHGYNMTIAGSTNYAESMFKRLWWRGYKGRFAAFRWNTYGNGTILNGGLGIGGAVGTYNDSEFVAWHSGTALKTFVQSLPSGYTIDVVSHSLGSVVVGEAIEEGMSPTHYALLHAAASASCYSTPAQVFPTTNTLTLFGSPDTSADPATYALAYRYAFKDIGSASPVNFYDDQDSVIGLWWYANNEAFKPQTIDGISSTYYYYHPANLPGQKLGFESDVLFRSLSDFGEARAYADFSLTQTIGSYDTTSAFGAISSGVNENQAGYNFGDHHSPEFNLSIQQLGPFYYDLLINFGIPQPFLDALHHSTE